LPLYSRAELSRTVLTARCAVFDGERGRTGVPRWHRDPHPVQKMERAGEANEQRDPASAALIGRIRKVE